MSCFQHLRNLPSIHLVPPSKAGHGYASRVFAWQAHGNDMNRAWFDTANIKFKESALKAQTRMVHESFPGLNLGRLATWSINPAWPFKQVWQVPTMQKHHETSQAIGFYLLALLWFPETYWRSEICFPTISGRFVPILSAAQNARVASLFCDTWDFEHTILHSELSLTSSAASILGPEQTCPYKSISFLSRSARSPLVFWSSFKPLHLEKTLRFSVWIWGTSWNHGLVDLSTMLYAAEWGHAIGPWKIGNQKNQEAQNMFRSC